MGKQQNFEDDQFSNVEESIKEDWKNMTDAELMAAVAKATVTEPEIIDVTKYEGQKAKIAKWSIMKGKFENPSILVETEPIEGKIKATLFLSVVYLTGRKEFGWFGGSKTEAFMKKHGAKTFDELIGKEVLLVIQPSKKGDNKNYLTFV